MNERRADSLNSIKKVYFLILSTLVSLLVPAVCYSQVEPLVVPLIAGQHINVGIVSVTNTDNEILVTYQTTGDWLIKETHLDVELTYGGLDKTKKGNPIPGKFTYTTTHSNPVVEVSFTIENFGWSVDSELYIAAHAVVTSSQGTETAWGDGLDFPGRNWATYFNYTVQAEQQEGPGVLQFSDAVYTVTEPGRFVRSVEVVITVTRTEGAVGTISANYEVIAGTATQDSDYRVENEIGTLVFANGETEKTFVVTVLDDSRVEDDFESIDLVLEAPCCLGELSTAQINIEDDDELH
ncbi:Calx-beta domain-containing protein [Kaarinaea lacus]